MKILMLGDSITDGFDTGKLLLNWDVNNQGVSGDSTHECAGRINGSWFNDIPYDYIFLCIGTNDLARYRHDDEILEWISHIYDKVRRHTKKGKFVFISLFPTRDNEPRPNDRIDGLNQKLHQLAEELRASYFDLNPYFKDESGRLKAEFTDDGLHLTDEGYQCWTGVLKVFISANIAETE
ncbi:GDSL-type esterase/lipase family protein [Limibacter armeniacum]|uniref:GDSL-type esterase/lipase family protein n=1 Tax=Limibacter armeniacum TaxID=466084 RepID=UPI002FE63F95